MPNEEQYLKTGEFLNAIDWDKMSGLIPVTVQDIVIREIDGKECGTVLMQAYMNREALEETLKTGLAVFWSRSRKELWRKGATSGNIQIVTGISLDCDGDYLVLDVISKGPACHTGNKTCFSRRLSPYQIGDWRLQVPDFDWNAVGGKPDDKLKL